MFEKLARFPLASLPTPVEFLPRLTALLAGPRIFIKRDDLTGLAGGGNKTRKLEFLVADAAARKADTLITLGGPQSNHCRQTAAAAARAGLRCVLILGGDPPPEITGNVLLNLLLGAEMIWSGARSREEVMDETVSRERAASHNPYPVTLGGSTPLGAAAYALAMEELAGQGAESFDRIIFASSSGGTHAGLAAGARLTGFRGEVLGISIDEEEASLQELVAEIAVGTMQLLGSPHVFKPADIRVNADYLGGGYAVLGAAEREAIRMFARSEGILLDPVYTGRAAAGMIDLVRRGIIRKGETVLFWHTGGVPALWAYSRQLTEP